MNRQKYPRLRPRQNGIALLVIVAVLMLGSTSIFFATQNLNSAALARQDSIARDLQKAKQGLIAFAVNYADYYNKGGAGPGHMPCADAHDSGDDDVGSPASSCKANKIGRLPTNWKTNGKKVIELYPFARTSPRRFWYLPSSSYRFCCSQKVNSDLPGEIRVDDRDDVVAVIIDPGPPLPGQTRPSDDAADYLEGGNEDGDEIFVTFSDGQFNDRLVFITRAEIMTLVEKRVLDYVYLWLQEFKNSHDYYPRPAALGDPNQFCDEPDRVAGLLRNGDPIDMSTLAECGESPVLPGWFYKNGWQHRIYYHVDRHCVHPEKCDKPAELALRVNGSTRAVLIVSAGAAIATEPKKPAVQNRQTGIANVLSGEVIEYLDSAESVNGDDSYLFADAVGESSNDLFMTLNAEGL